MCIAILNTKNTLPDSYIKNSWDNNDQGGGILWNEGGKLRAYKTYNYSAFLKKYKEIRSRIDSKMVLHFRIATSGYESKSNLHPFLVNDSLGFVHNGVISGLGNKDFSDTYQFNEMLKTLPENFLQNECIISLITKYIGSSKLVFLDSDDNHKIVNENLGHWDNARENWYSNDSYLSYNDYVWEGNTKVARGKECEVLDWEDYSWNKSFNKKSASLIFNDSDYERQRFAALVGIDENDTSFYYELRDWADYYGIYNLEELNNLIEFEYSNEYTD